MRYRHIYRTLNKGLQSLLAAFLILCYLAANVQFESLHSLAHRDEAEISHHVADENDPCHRKLYHHDFSKGCEHSAHFIASKKCSLCDHHLTTDKIVYTETKASEFRHSFSFLSVAILAAPTTHALQIPARGPPLA
jgi:hypothetical protein